MNKGYIYLISVTLIFFACTKKIPQLTTNKSFEFFSSKIKASYKDANNSYSFNINMRCKTDSIIWGSVSIPPGIEVLRFQITEDSIQALNKLKKEYYAFNIESLKRKINYDIDFKMLQSIINGEMPIKDYQPKNIKKQKEGWEIKQTLNDILITNKLNKNLSELNAITISSDTSKSNIKINYTDYELTNGVNFPTKQNYTALISQKEEDFTPDINLRFTKVKFSNDVLNFPFNVSSKYQKK